jgi:polyribonucleotide nucleotidyltransferase
MDAGVPISQPVAGISIGLFEWEGERKLVTDILGEEDHFGLMDFKVAGTGRGITGIQLDLKARGLDRDTIMETLKVAKQARLKILKKMLQALPAPRESTSPQAPRILTTKIKPERIGKVIGPGGRGIRAIEAETKARVEIDDDGTILISCLDMAGAERALEIIEAIGTDVKVGKIYKGKVVSIKDFGAFIEVAPGQEGLCHISELDTGYVKSVSDVVQVGDTVRVKVILVDEQDRIKLSRKAAMEEEESSTEQAAAT